MSRKLKLGLITFILFDAFLAVTFVSLYRLQSERDFIENLRAIGFTLYPEPRDISSFTLTDEHGTSFTEAGLRGQWNFLFFGFTSCPDICPVTMSELRQFYSALTVDEQAQAQVVMISVDPARDDPAAMAAYVDSFNEEFVGLTGNYGVISNMASEFFVAHSKPVPVAQAMTHDDDASHNTHTTASVVAGENYLIEHSGHLAVVDPNGKFVAVMRSPVRDRDITTAFRALLAEY